MQNAGSSFQNRRSYPHDVLNVPNHRNIIPADWPGFYYYSDILLVLSLIFFELLALPTFHA